MKVIQLLQECRIVGATAGDLTGNLWDVCLFEFGVSKDQRLLFTNKISAASLAKCEGAKIFALRSGQHQDASKFGKPPVDIIAICTKPEIRTDGVYAQANFLPTGYGIRDNLKAAREAGLPDPYGLSVDIDAKAAVVKQGNMKLLMPIEFSSITIDVVYDPAAGGKFLQMAASIQSTIDKENDMIKKLLAALLATHPVLSTQLTAGMEAGTITDDQALEQITAAMVAEVKTPGTVVDSAAITAAVVSGLKGLLDSQTGAELQDVKVMACGLALDRALQNSGLPLPSQANMRKTFEGKIFAAVELDDAIKAKKEELDALTLGTGLVLEAGQLRASVSVDQKDKHDTMLDDFFAGKLHSFKACYQEITGDTLVTGRLRDAVKIQAAVTTATFDQSLGDSIARRMIAEYNSSGLDDWKKICTVVPVSDFRTQRRVRLGGYGDLPAVAQAGPYNALTSPLDEEATYAATKRGGTEVITLEAIKNDDVGVLRRIPVRLGRAAARTLYKFVFDTLQTNAALYDAVALFHATHANLTVSALAKATLQAGRLAMMKQTEQGSAEPLGIGPRYLIVPLDLADAAYELVAQPNLAGFTPTAANSVTNQTWEIIPVKTWADANNWFLSADPNDIPTIEVGFLDGKQEPELFVQDLPNVGSMFSNDQLTYKIRHVYGGTVEDYRGLYGGIVP